MKVLHVADVWHSMFLYTQLIQFAMHRLAIFIPSAPRYNIQLPLNSFILLIRFILLRRGGLTKHI
jgi:hypothetical protein